MTIHILIREVITLEQHNRRSGNRPGQQPPVVSGSEPRRRQTGVATCRTAPSTAAAMPRGEQGGLCRDGTGTLPPDAPLANPYVPFQRENPQRYPTQRALARGTLYPGLDLPLMGMVNADAPETPLTELMALEFAVTELGLYLDMHPEDSDALAVFRDYTARAAEARSAYEQHCGPLTLDAAGQGDTWGWTRNPWPWDFCREG